MLSIPHRSRIPARSGRRHARPLLALAAAASLLLAGCAEGADPQPTAEVPAAAPTTTGAVAGDRGAGSPTDDAATATTRTTRAAAATEGAAKTTGASSGTGKEQAGKPSGENAPDDYALGAARTVVITVKGRTVSPKPGAVRLKKGEPMLLVVVTDRDSAVHVHGLDLEKETTAKLPTEFTLKFAEKGSYEVELHDPELLLTKIVVS